MRPLTDPDTCVACVADNTKKCGGPRGAVAVYTSAALPTTFDDVGTTLKDETGAALAADGMVETNKDVYLHVNHGAFICGAHDADPLKVNEHFHNAAIL